MVRRTSPTVMVSSRRTWIVHGSGKISHVIWRTRQGGFVAGCDKVLGESGLSRLST